jgi:RNA polymerase sigma factor (sigma-70 family)
VARAIEEVPLVESARAHDRGAFEALVHTRLEGVYRLCLTITGNEQDAADAAQETFINAWRGLSRLKEADRFDAWLQRIAVNSCRMILRSRGRRRIHELTLSAPGVTELAGSERSDDESVRATRSTAAASWASAPSTSSRRSSPPHQAGLRPTRSRTRVQSARAAFLTGIQTSQ